MPPTKFGVNWLLGLGEEAKIDFQDGHHGGHLEFPIGHKKKQKIDFQDGRHGGHLGYPIGMILAIFDL